MEELKSYLALHQQVKANSVLMSAISEYESGREKLRSLMNSKSYDIEEAVRLTNDTQNLFDLIQSNPLYHAYAEARSAYEQSLADCGTCRCAGNCTKCGSVCVYRTENEEDI